MFTPQGDVINLPAGATPIDFAYAIHSAVGNSMVGVRVNGRISSYDYALQNGDIVEVITSKTSKGPGRDWVKLARSNEARTKIRQWFKREKRDENIARGKQSLEAELRKNNINTSVLSSEEIMPEILGRMKVQSLDDLFAAIGYGGVTAVKAVNRIRDELARQTRVQSDKTAIERLLQESKKPKQTQSGLIVEDLDNCLTKFSRCCTPVPGDDIIGFITKGFGVSVHRTNCANVAHAMQTEGEGRWVNVSWANTPDQKYDARLEISAKDRDNFVADVVTAVTANKVKVMSISAKALPDSYAVVSLIVAVTDIQQLSEVINRIKRVAGVVEIRRANS